MQIYETLQALDFLNGSLFLYQNNFKNQSMICFLRLVKGG